MDKTSRPRNRKKNICASEIHYVRDKRGRERLGKVFGLRKERKGVWFGITRDGKLLLMVKTIDDNEKDISFIMDYVGNMKNKCESLS